MVDRRPANSSSTSEADAGSLDAADPLRAERALFHIPSAAAVSGNPALPGECIYLCGNSLGLMPRAARAVVEQELHDWATLGVEGHLRGANPWLPYHEQFRESGARLVGARPGEVVMMNSLTVNLHLMMVTFYRPTAERHRIVIQDSSFPSDAYAVASQADHHRFGPDEAVVKLRPRPGEDTLRTEDVEAFLRRDGAGVALVIMEAVNYITGQWLDVGRITAAAHAAGCRVGWDLAHAAGNVPLQLHDWGVDFAAWCSYKYLNAGPGAVAGCFVHEKHGRAAVPPPRFAGWWGNDPATRFRMEPRFAARDGADGWQLSNPPIFSLAPLRASLDIFDRVGMAALREKSVRLTGHLERLIDEMNGRLPAPRRVGVLTPRDPAARGCAISLRLSEGAKEVLDALLRAGVVCDFREPDVIRVAPVPLYNTFTDVWRFAQVLESLLGGTAPRSSPV